MRPWSPRQESNLDLTLRRRVHYPLCYGERRAKYTGATVAICLRNAQSRVLRVPACFALHGGVLIHTVCG
ncbi:hypothetical protein SBBP1_80035 [Burkholderiales bacterium]|nr:hypothetical protein SBBP1_80035 [Burkholderiales bacterium]